MQYIIKSANNSFTGIRNRGSMSLTFKDGMAETDKKNVAEYWDKQPGYACVNLKGDVPPPEKVKVKLLVKHGKHEAGKTIEVAADAAQKMIDEKIAEPLTNG